MFFNTPKRVNVFKHRSLKKDMIQHTVENTCIYMRFLNTIENNLKFKNKKQ